MQVEYDECDEDEGYEDSIKTITTLYSCIQDSDDCDDDNEEEHEMESGNFVKSLFRSLTLTLSLSPL